MCVHFQGTLILKLLRYFAMVEITLPLVSIITIEVQSCSLALNRVEVMPEMSV